MRIYQILFSPTGGTKKATAPFAEVFGREVSTIDLTDASMDFSQISLEKEDICVVAVPSFGGRVPAIAVERLERIRANGAMAILVVVYGNRAYDDTLLELKTRLKRAGFRCAAAVAAVRNIPSCASLPRAVPIPVIWRNCPDLPKRSAGVWRRGESRMTWPFQAMIHSGSIPGFPSSPPPGRTVRTVGCALSNVLFRRFQRQLPPKPIIKHASAVCAASASVRFMHEASTLS